MKRVNEIVKGWINYFRIEDKLEYFSSTTGGINGHSVIEYTYRLSMVFLATGKNRP
ncbi:MAG: group II intron maturase-specific domain-containing protein [Lachnospiraceae bacterium]|nr:group II intron maturase-specific domain-containing protein [Lachnospiraceae bacterium]